MTRNGYHIIYPVEISEQNGKKMWHAKHILIQTTGFDAWLVSQTNGVEAKLIKKF